jgi:hypothetical protein
MKKILPFLVVASVLILFSCNKDEAVVEPKLSDTMIQPDNLEVGQVNYYLRFEGEKYYDNSSNNLFSYTNDTLKIEVIEELDGGRFLVQENYTPGSEILEGENAEYYREVKKYYMYLENENLVIERTTDDMYSTHLIYAFSLGEWGSGGEKVEFPLSLFTEKETTIEGWKTTNEYIEAYGEYFAKDVTLLEHNFGTANVIVNNVPMQVDGNGMTYVYNRTYGFVRSFTYSWWTGGGSGWDLMVP